MYLIHVSKVRTIISGYNALKHIIMACAVSELDHMVTSSIDS